MMYKFTGFRRTLMAASLLLASGAYAAEGATDEKVSVEVANNISRAFKMVRPDWQLQSVTTSRMPGLYKVQILNGPLLYSSASGLQFVAGDLFEITPKGFVNISEYERSGDRAKLMADVARKDMIIFSPAGETKDYVTVFTDIDCGYCRKLHAEVPKLNEMGIEVRYMAYPRAGIGSKSYNKIVTAWCADDPNKALTSLKQGKTMSLNMCKDNPVAKQFLLGQEIGVSGTPAIITSSGQLLPGYMPADKLAQAIEL
ncbi:DsbC family protein [Dasania sp. GY-MA-18]|uniref:Thiol:disulfide interchange protein n=1 Tax=Dasania phycosphaerae TaxID=2950436 RepID=A0A9J6RMD2_9GAMM|nr:MULTISPECIES: DsbC family protein [Dasania]MCR8922711.1 DsbC family protein [Dasania sp. GY-MA-18]MCZ0865141.1 DsbC family protein [Dasania phycosphaerae]MCZ0868867.1 DsbC family protein [Dasania phycosphaerae]